MILMVSFFMMLFIVLMFFFRGLSELMMVSVGMLFFLSVLCLMLSLVML